MNHLVLPKELEIYRSNIASTVKPVIHLTAEKGETSLLESKFAGHPYLPKSMEHPKDEHGLPLKLLAQLNLEELPKLEFLPEKGILQFFIAGNDDVMGIDFDNMCNQSNFRVVYHSTIIEDETFLVTDFSYMDQYESESFPIQNELKLSFQLDYEPVSIGDFRNNDLLGDSVDLSQIVEEDSEKELWEVYCETFTGDGHKMGGYPYFTQTDPREYDPNLEEHDILLFQMDSDDENGIMWGDCGVANFFIKKEDLKKLDFSNVIYNWDCC